MVNRRELIVGVGAAAFMPEVIVQGNTFAGVQAEIDEALAEYYRGMATLKITDRRLDVMSERVYRAYDAYWARFFERPAV